MWSEQRKVSNDLRPTDVCVAPINLCSLQLVLKVTIIHIFKICVQNNHTGLVTLFKDLVGRQFGVLSLIELVIVFNF